MKHKFGICALVFAMALLAAQPALAARIYNFTPITVKLAGSTSRGSSFGQLALATGMKSQSGNWNDWARIKVEDPNAGVTICAIDAHGKLQGGNYMVVGHVGSRVHCALCDSVHRIITNGAGDAPYNWQGKTQTSC